VTTPPLHVVFNPSAAGGLRKALGEAGRGDRVVSFFDDLSFGPINPPDPEARRQWVEEELGYAGWEDVTNTDAFWQEALEPSPKIAWVSRRTTQEYTGFLEWLRRLGGAPCQINDLTDVTAR
jgi:hypothetical protein